MRQNQRIIVYELSPLFFLGSETQGAIETHVRGPRVIEVLVNHIEEILGLKVLIYVCLLNQLYFERIPQYCD
jgi:hypothetical protein